MIGHHDDITSKSISRAFKRKYSFNSEAVKFLKKYYGNEFNDPKKKWLKCLGFKVNIQSI